MPLSVYPILVFLFDDTGSSCFIFISYIWLYSRSEGRINTPRTKLLAEIAVNTKNVPRSPCRLSNACTSGPAINILDTTTYMSAEIQELYNLVMVDTVRW